MKILKNLVLASSLTFSISVVALAQTTPAPKPTATVPRVETKSTAPVLPKADEIIDKFVAATGGEAAYKKLNSFYTKGSFEMPAMGLKGTFESFHKAPNKSAVFMKFPGIGDISEVFDGTSSWANDPVQGLREKTGDELAQTKIDADFYRFVRLKELFPKRETKGIEKVEGADAYAVVMTVGDIVQTYYFDVKTNFIIRVDQIAATPEGKIPTQTSLSDYRKVEGVLMPYTMRLNAASNEFTFKTEEIKANVAVEDAKFAKPAK